MDLYGLLQLMGKIPIDQGGVRLDGTLGNAAYFAVYMLFSIFFALVLLYREWDQPSLRYTYIFIGVVDTIMLLASETRGTILGLIGGLVIAALYLLIFARHDESVRTLRRWSWWYLGVLAVLVIVFFGIRSSPWVSKVPALDRLASISLQDETTQSRFIIWHMAWEGFKERPVFGWGQDNFNFVFNKFYSPVMYDQEQWFDRAHNAFLDWLMNSGALGFLLFISLFGTAAWMVVRSEELSRAERAAWLGLVAAYAFHELFVFDNLVSYVQFFTVLALVHGISQRQVPGRVWLSRPMSHNGMAVAAPIVAVVTVGGAWMLNAPGIANATGLITALSRTSTSSRPCLPAARWGGRR
jgi:O-antigen ligase